MINRQQHTTTCGPVALKNALEFSGVKSNYQEILEFSEQYLGFRYRGLYYKNLELGLKYLGLNYKKIYKPNLDKINKILEKGNGCILDFKWSHKGKNGGHYIFIDKKFKNYYRAWNWARSENEFSCKSIDLQDFFRYSNRWWKGYLKLWEIKKL